MLEEKLTLYMEVMLEHLSWLHSTPTQGVPPSPPVSRLLTRPSTCQKIPINS